jgi:CheY-like chemotaxis protein
MGKRILYVEDHADALEAMSRLLEMAGFTVARALSAGEAMKAAQADRFDLLICDLNLPDGSGADVATQICAQQQIPAIAITGTSIDPSDRQNLPFKGHLLKPVNFDTLQEMIRSLLA